MLVPLPCVKPSGGVVPRLVVLLQRKYPSYNWQRTSDGRAAVLTPKAHAAALRRADSCAAKVSNRVERHKATLTYLPSLAIREAQKAFGR